MTYTVNVVQARPAPLIRNCVRAQARQLLPQDYANALVNHVHANVGAQSAAGIAFRG